MTLSAPAPRPADRATLPADDLPEVDWNDPRRAITHALAMGPRLGWKAAEGGDKEIITITYSRGFLTRQIITCRYSIMNGFYRFAGATFEGHEVRAWPRVATVLYSRPPRTPRRPRH